MIRGHEMAPMPMSAREANLVTKQPDYNNIDGNVVLGDEVENKVELKRDNPTEASNGYLKGMYENNKGFKFGVNMATGILALGVIAVGVEVLYNELHTEEISASSPVELFV